MNREAILANLRGIWSALCNGDAAESQIGSFLYLAIMKLESYWNGINKEVSKPIFTPRGEEEIFLDSIADFD